MRQLYTIYDALSKKSGPVFETTNLDSAKRICRNLFWENKGYDPKDLALVYLGKLSDNELNIISNHKDDEDFMKPIFFTDILGEDRYNEILNSTFPIREDKDETNN